MEKQHLKALLAINIAINVTMAKLNERNFYGSDGMMSIKFLTKAALLFHHNRLFFVIIIRKLLAK